MTAGGSTPILETIGLCMRFGGLRALEGVNFVMNRGELRFLIGPNGAGKTTFFNVVTGKLKPTSGQVRFLGEPITHLRVHQVVERGVARTFQISSIFEGLRVRDNIMIAAQKRWESFNPLAGRADGGSGAKESAEEIIREVGLEERGSMLAGALSLGEKKRLELGMALALNPRLLLLDEPTSGLNNLETSEMARLVKKISGPLSILIIEHDIEFMKEIAEMVTVLHKGQILAEGPVSEIERSEKVRQVYLDAE